ncbi:hypothetical protein ACIF6L_33955 [Kitasatospora sp. NPDC086009]|uniref:hypothetical protein n=1 Tax=unclassified Kitasatospora TaxID=2633591 RepID=UPI0037CCA228
MEAEIVQGLVTSGATTLVGLMATEAWTQARSRFAALFGRGETDEAEAAALERSRTVIARARETGDTGAVDDLTGTWRGRLRQALLENPEVADELRAILAEFEPRLPAPGGESLNNTITGRTMHGMVIQAKNVHGGAHFHQYGEGPGRPSGGR